MKYHIILRIYQENSNYEAGSYRERKESIGEESRNQGLKTTLQRNS